MKNIFKPNNLIVVGVPGAGKSTFINEFINIAYEKGYKTSNHGDYPFLQELFRKDKRTNRKDRFVENSEGEFEVIDENIYDDVLQMIHDDILVKDNQDQKSIKIIEFARPHYRSAFLKFTLKSLIESVIVHISSPFEVCCLRNESRRLILEEKLSSAKEAQDIFNENPDLHYVPQVVMDRYYARDLKEDSERLIDQILEISFIPSKGYFHIDNVNSRDNFVLVSQRIIINKIIPLFEIEESYRDFYNRRNQIINNAFVPIPI